MVKTVQITGLPDDLYRKLKERATANHRTIAGEVRAILTSALQWEEEPVVEPSEDDNAKLREREKLRKAMTDWARRKV